MSVDYGGTHENTGQHGSSSQFASFSDHIDNRACYFCLDLHALIVRRRYPMLKATSEEVKLCYERALEAERQANNARTPADSEFWLNTQKRWLCLAAHAQYREQIATFVADLQQRHRRPVCSPCDAPMRVKQVRCRNDKQTEYHYECTTCGAKQTIVE